MKKEQVKAENRNYKIKNYKIFYYTDTFTEDFIGIW